MLASKVIDERNRASCLLDDKDKVPLMPLMNPPRTLKEKALTMVLPMWIGSLRELRAERKAWCSSEPSESSASITEVGMRRTASRPSMYDNNHVLPAGRGDDIETNLSGEILATLISMCCRIACITSTAPSQPMGMTRIAIKVGVLSGSPILVPGTGKEKVKKGCHCGGRVKRLKADTRSEESETNT